MEFEPTTRVIYVTEEGDQVFTFIREVNANDGSYMIDFEGTVVPEHKLKLNNYSDFSVPRSISKDHIRTYHYDQLIDHIVTYLNEHHADKHLKIYREMDTIYFETVFRTPKTPEEKKLFQEVVDKFNKVIGQVNKAIKSRFNKLIEVILKFPSNTHHLHSIRV
ncbi:hypothetical protein [Pedobacter nyackensis]|uniref:hypothetical protein n=1 Tax=Pedobacter nyackensis TaxID=475255 RepID=UPI00292FEE35|nr:hypothetical protein [Pedobacter nyackensis]